MIRPFALALLAMPVATVVIAHPGDHTHMSAGELLAHSAEPAHAALIAAVLALVGALAWRSVRRSHAEARKTTRTSRRGRS